MYVNFESEIEVNKLKKIAEIIKKGGIVIVPTETVYGIGADCFNDKAVEKIYDVKKRPRDKAISLLISDLKMLDDIAVNITEDERKIMETFFPGPLTIILEKSSKVSNIVTAGKDTVGVRMPENEIALKLINEVRKTISYTEC